MTLPQLIREAQRRIDAGDVSEYNSPFERLADNRPLIKCARVSCGQMFRQNRPHQRYCNTTCQVGHWNDGLREKARLAKEAASQGQEAAKTAGANVGVTAVPNVGECPLGMAEKGTLPT